MEILVVHDYGASKQKPKHTLRATRAFIKPFDTPQRSVKMKI